jgi:hypothetical protein
MVRAKIKIDYIVKDRHQTTQIVASPVIRDGEEENDKFFNTTPAGRIELTVRDTETSAAAFFEVGKEYYIDFAPVDQAAKQ